jgi:hypothetical protein
MNQSTSNPRILIALEAHSNQTSTDALQVASIGQHLVDFVGDLTLFQISIVFCHGLK